MDFRPMWGMRHTQALLIFLNITVVYISRLNVGVAVVAMTNAATTNPDFEEFDWTNEQKQYVISSFYWGYVITQFPGGLVTKRFGAKITMFTSTFLSALMSSLIPWCARVGGWQAYCVIRVVQGLFQGALFPSINEHLAKWVPVRERNRLGALSQTGIECGTVLAMATSGLIAHGPLGWPGISYVAAGICFAWCIVWWIFASNNATESRFITEAEKQYIETSLEHSEDHHKKKIPIPWKAIWLSVPFISLILVRASGGYGLGILQGQIPAYMNGVLHMDIKQNALYSSLPFLAMWCMSYVYVAVADIIQYKNLLTLTGIRKTINSIGFCVPAAGLIGIGFLDEKNRTWAIVLMTILTGFSSGATIGNALNAIDLSPNHAGVLIGINNPIGNFSILIAPLTVGAIVTDTSSRTQWQIIFLIAASIFFFGNLIYVIWGSAQPQPWDADDFLTAKNVQNTNQVTPKVDTKTTEAK